MPTNKCHSVVTGTITELDTGRAIIRNWYLSLGTHESFIEEGVI